MFEHELKNKIVNTISQYKDRCDKLEDEITVLKSAIYQLSLLPNGIYVGVDRQMHNLQANLQKNQDSSKIKKSVDHLVHAINSLENKKQESKARISDFVTQGTHLLSKIIKVEDKNTFEQIERLLRIEGDEGELLTKFMKLFKDSIQLLTKQLNVYQPNSHSAAAEFKKTQLPLNTHVNAQLNQIVEHLLIPENLVDRINALKLILSKQLTPESLSEAIDNLADLVIDAFNIEHNQFKDILNKFTHYLQDFGNYLQLSCEHNQEAKKETNQLEKDLGANLKAIRRHFNNSPTIEELSAKVSGQLKLIDQQIKHYKANEAQRIKGYEEQIICLQSKLGETESVVESIKRQLSAHKLKVNQDPLTGLPNRSAYDELIVSAFNRWQRGFGELSVALADLDHFKSINDQYGHLAGDKVLEKTAAIFRKSLRAVDFVARYGGEEFIFIFEHTAAHLGWKVLENLRIAIEETEFYYREQRVIVTASFGITALRHGDSIETVFVRADEAMYQAKNKGRNAVVIR